MLQIKLLGDLMHFLLVFCLFAFPFVYAFYHIAEDSSSRGTGDFSSLSTAHYTMFTMMLNMVDLSSLPAEDKTSLFILHVAFVVLVVILLLNFLIALFASSVAYVNDNKAVIQTVQRLAIVWLLELRLEMVLGKFYIKYRIGHFPNENGKVFVRDVRISCKHRTNRPNISADQ